ncbi:hypothetical protein EJ06DRAFT_548694 [Trichodelitschia bisporula]|uniref:Uncharacterized protein n=1 Tax=Trichodelitschia bisporula TaxID=703511 RepID=A0A6G1HXY0_9PEZI|nr:hypothetical protein EJ06DRAFT_548694 [Trichodelitschia bisporula]
MKLFCKSAILSALLFQAVLSLRLRLFEGERALPNFRKASTKRNGSQGQSSSTATGTLYAFGGLHALKLAKSAERACTSGNHGGATLEDLWDVGLQAYVVVGASSLPSGEDEVTNCPELATHNMSTTTRNRPQIPTPIVLSSEMWPLGLILLLTFGSVILTLYSVECTIKYLTVHAREAISDYGRWALPHQRPQAHEGRQISNRLWFLAPHVQDRIGEYASMLSWAWGGGLRRLLRFLRWRQVNEWIRLEDMP